MLKDVLLLGSFGTASYAWLSAIVAPLVCAARAVVRERGSRRAMAALGLAAGGAVLWTFVPAGLLLLGMILEPRVGLMLLHTTWIAPGLALGVCAWCLHLAVERTLPRLGTAFETAITASRPKTRYVITAAAHMMMGLRRWLGDRGWDAMMRTQFPTPKGV